MKRNRPSYIIVEPYFGGSHRAFVRGLCHHVPADFTLFTLPARKWKMRMQLAAPWMAAKVAEYVREGGRPEAVLCSSMMDVASFRAILDREKINIPIAVFFHENQFAYPNQIEEPAYFQFTALNYTTALAADTFAFNSQFNRETFFRGVKRYLKKATDMDLTPSLSELAKRSTVLYPGIDFTGCNPLQPGKPSDVPVIVWNHRWEHDKDPETFFAALAELSRSGGKFQLVILGQEFERSPAVFSQAVEDLAGHLLHCGYVPDRDEYLRLLAMGDIVVSTAVHEFFGMAVLEAVRCGCRPLVPDRLSYRELFPQQYRYEGGSFTEAIGRAVEKPSRLTVDEATHLAETYSWQHRAGSFAEWLQSLG